MEAPMSMKEKLKEISKSSTVGNLARAGAVGAALMGAPVGRGAPVEGQNSSEPQTISQYAEPLIMSQEQRDIQDQLRLNQYLANMGTYDAERDAGIDKKDFDSMVKYALQLDAQLACADENAETRLTVISGAVDNIFRPLIGNEEITFGDYSLNPKGLRDFWKESGSSFDFSDGLNLVLKYPDASGKHSDKPFFIIDVPQAALTGSIKEISGVYNSLDDIGVTQFFKDSADEYKNMTPEEQKEMANKFMADLNNGELGKKLEGDPELKNRFQKDLTRIIPLQYNISVSEGGRIRPATKEDASVFYDMLAENVLALNEKGAIDLGDMAAKAAKKESSGFFGGLKAGIIGIGASFATDGMLRDGIDEKIKEPVITAFNEAIAQSELRRESKTLSDTQQASKDSKGAVGKNYVSNSPVQMLKYRSGR